MSQLLRFAGGENDRQASVVFVHGLDGDPYETWRRPADPDSLWPLWLAKDIPGLAVFSVGYEAPISRWRGAAMHLTDRATSLLERLLLEPDLQDGPLILIGHSLGGLVIKQLLRTAESEARVRVEAASLLRRVSRVAFLATPHTGSGWATWGDRLRILLCPSAATASLVRNDPYLRDLNLWYRNWTSSAKVANLILVETRPTSIFPMIVRPDSSDPGIEGSRPIPIDANHRDISKPKDKTSDSYLQVRAFIKRSFNLPQTMSEKNRTDGRVLQPANAQSAQTGSLSNNITINIFGGRDNVDVLVAELLRAIEQRSNLGPEQNR